MEESEKQENMEAFGIEEEERKAEYKFGCRLLGKGGWKTAVFRTSLSLVVFCSFIYFFLLNLSLLSAGVKILFAPHAHAILNNENYDENHVHLNGSTNVSHSRVSPILGFFLGDLSAALLQSSSATSSIVVSMVAEDAISVRAAFPIIMGANVGTTVTSTIVSMALFSERKSLRRAFTAATMHDMFNIFTSFIVLPLDWLTGGAMELMTMQMVGIDEVDTGKQYILSSEPRALLLQNKTKYEGDDEPEEGSDNNNITMGTPSKSESEVIELTGEDKEITTESVSVTEVNETTVDSRETTTESVLASHQLSVEYKQSFIENASYLKPDTKKKLKELIKGKKRQIFYENEEESIVTLLNDFRKVKDNDLAVRNGFGNDEDDIRFRIGDIFAEDLNLSQLHENPISQFTRPLTHYIIQLNDYDMWNETNKIIRNCSISYCHPRSFLFENWYLQGHSEWGLGIILLLVSTISIVVSIFLISKFFKSIMDMDNVEQRFEKFQFNIGNYKYGELYGILLMLLGLFISGIIQSSSAFTSMLVPLAANQIICLDSAYALTLGGNMGRLQIS